jgi:hypothetical protein
MMLPQTNVQWAIEFAAMGIGVLPIVGKDPSINGDEWQSTVITDPAAVAARFAQMEARLRMRCNVGLFLGRRFVDWDADDDRVRRLWDLAPPSGFAFGRLSLPRDAQITHRWYAPVDYPQTFHWPTFKTYERSGKPRKILEIRSGNAQTMGPGSLNPKVNDELVVWLGDYPLPMPAQVRLSELIDAARLVAAAVITSYVWPGPGHGMGHDFALWLCGGLAFHGLDADRIRVVVENAAALVSDPDYQERGESAERAVCRLAAGEPVEGFPKLEQELTLPNFGKHLCQALGLPWGGTGKTSRPVTVGGQHSPTSSPTTTPTTAPVPPPPPTVAAEPRTIPEQIHMHTVKPVAVTWHWPQRFPVGRLSLLAGMGGLGKSLLTTYMAAITSTTGKWPDGTYGPTGSTLIVSAEDAPDDTIRPRLDLAGADCEKVFALTGIRLARSDGSSLVINWDIGDLDILEAALDAQLAMQHTCRLVIIDPIGSYLGGEVDAYRDNTVRAKLTPLAMMAQRRQIAIVLVAHVRKGAANYADDMVLGSRAFTALCRSVMHLVIDEDKENRRLLLPGKSNLCKPAAGLAFTIEDGPRIVWEAEPLDLSANAHYRTLGPRKAPGPRGDTLEAGKDFLLTALAEGPQEAKALQQRALQQRNLSIKTLRRAREDLGIIVYQPEGSKDWYWRLPSASDI